MNIPIIPTEITLTDLFIGSVNVSLDNSAIVNGFITNSDKVTKSYSLYMDPETYAQWGSNDEFVIDWTLSQLGLEKL